jgi:hypothetical protein
MNVDARTPRRNGTSQMTKAKKIIEAKSALAKTPSKKAASSKKIALRVKPVAKAAKTKRVVDAATIAAPVPVAPEPRAKSKGATILALIGRADGATLAEIMKATAWQRHSVRGWISTAGKKFTIESSKSAEGERTYRSVAP